MKLLLREYTKIDFDSVEAGKIFQSKKCLYDIYKEIYYSMVSLRNRLLRTGGQALEIGSGGGFFKSLFPDVITSDVRKIKGVDCEIDAQSLPFPDNSLDVIYAVHTLHHIPNVDSFLTEASRVLRLGGGIVCVEPYWSLFAKFVYRTLHPEPFDERAESWLLPPGGPISASNQAMSYILLKRDRRLFEKKHPTLKVVYQKPFGFIRYIATGGIWLSQKVPGFIFPALKCIEYLLTPLMPFFAIHHMFVLKKHDE